MSDQHEDNEVSGPSRKLFATSISVTGDQNIVAGRNLKIGQYITNTTVLPPEAPKPTKDIWFNVQDPIKSFTGREQQIVDLHEEIQKNRKSDGRVTNLSITAVVAGLGGIGKTETVLEYIHQYGKNYYKHLIWIDAENSFSAKAQFEKLAKELFEKQESEEDFTDLIQRTFEFLCEHPNKVLFVFDNAESMDEIEGIRIFLPKSLNHTCEKPTILVTSRNQNWPRTNVIKLDVWAEDESIQFILKQLQLSETEENKTRALHLAELYGHLPVAIQIAVGKICQESKISTLHDGTACTIEDQIRDYNQERKKTLSAKSINAETTIKTLWTVTFNKILKRPKGELALNILCTISYLSPTCIPKEMLRYIFKEQCQDFSRAMHLLTNYCFITNYKNHFTLHRLIQDVTIEHMKARTSNTTENASGNTFIYPTKDSVVLKLIDHMQKYLDIISMSSNVYSDVADNLIYICNKMSYEIAPEKYFNFILFAIDKLKDIWMDEALHILNVAQLQQQRFKPSDHNLKVNIKTKIAYLLQRKGQYEESKSMYT